MEKGDKKIRTSSWSLEGGKSTFQWPPARDPAQSTATPLYIDPARPAFLNANRGMGGQQPVSQQTVELRTLW